MVLVEEFSLNYICGSLSFQQNPEPSEWLERDKSSTLEAEDRSGVGWVQIWGKPGTEEAAPPLTYIESRGPPGGTPGGAAPALPRPLPGAGAGQGGARGLPGVAGGGGSIHRYV